MARLLSLWITLLLLLLLLNVVVWLVAAIETSARLEMTLGEQARMAGFVGCGVGGGRGGIGPGSGCGQRCVPRSRSALSRSTCSVCTGGLLLVASVLLVA